VQTFIVRVWTPADDQSPPSGGLRGRVSHVESGRVRSFAGSEQLLAFLTAEQEAREAPEPERRA
jgi:hypothetical protein